MGEWALPPDETVVFTQAAPRRRRRAQARRPAGCAAASGATSRSSTARSTTSTSRCCGRPRKVARDAGRAREGTRRSDHLHRGQSNDCYWHGLFGGIYISHMRLATLRAPDRRRGRRRRARSARARGAELLDLDMDGRPEVRLAERRPGRDRQAVRGRRASARWDIRAARHALGGGAAPPARGLPRDAARPRRQGRGRGRRRHRPTDGGASPRSTTS